MEQYIKKSDIVAEIERRISVLKANESIISMLAGGMFVNEFKDLLSFLDTLEVKDANEALHTEYEKGRADVITDTLSWLENCWPKYCSNQTIIEGFKEAIKGE